MLYCRIIIVHGDQYSRISRLPFTTICIPHDTLQWNLYWTKQDKLVKFWLQINQIDFTVIKPLCLTFSTAWWPLGHCSAPYTRWCGRQSWAGTGECESAALCPTSPHQGCQDVSGLAWRAASSPYTEIRFHLHRGKWSIKVSRIIKSTKLKSVLIVTTRNCFL